MSLTHRDLRKKFKAFWEKRGHHEVPPSPLTPKEEDSSTLFTGSGMQQFVRNLLGEPHPQGTQLFDIQPCFRAQDIDEVGDNRHTTFFEMMGNWSLGAYFKEKQLNWFFDFLVKELDLDPTRLYVTVFSGYKNIAPKDSESEQIWKEQFLQVSKNFYDIGIKEITVNANPAKGIKKSDRIFYYGVDKNWWSRSGVPDKMPVGEVGGPDSEVFFDFDPDEKKNIHSSSPYSKLKCHPNCECGRFLEIGNSVFIEFKKNNDGFLPLPNKNVDFGGGLERLLAASQDDPDVFKIDVIWPVIELIQEVSKKKYQGNERKMRMIADHVKAATFLIANGIIPFKQDRGSVLRRLIKDTIDSMRDLGIGHSIISYFAQKVIDIYKDTYSELKIYSEKIMNVLNQEEKEYINYIVSSENNLKKILQHEGLNFGGKISPDGKRIIGGKILFNLKQSRGISLPTISRFLQKSTIYQDYKLDIEGYNNELEKHRKISREGATKKFKGGLADHSEQVIKYHTATHLLHQALFDVLGDKVRQEGSNITGVRLRFDFFATNKPTDDEIKKVEEIVNKKISEALPVNFKILPKSEADKVGARSFFKEKYGDQVKVYYIGADENHIQDAYSKEFCGGPHVKNTKEIGKLKIDKFKKIGSNLYRIYAI